METPLNHAELKKKMGLHPSVRLIIAPSPDTRERVAQKFAALREEKRGEESSSSDCEADPPLQVEPDKFSRVKRIEKAPLELYRAAKKKRREEDQKKSEQISAALAGFSDAELQCEVSRRQSEHSKAMC